MKKIKLTNSKDEILVDDEDYLRCSIYKWCLSSFNHGGQTIYSTKRLLNNKSVNITNYINNKYGVIFDHKDRNIFNDQKINLREVTVLQNNANRAKRLSIKDTSQTSKYKGVCWDKGAKKWMARICIKSKNIYLGKYVDEVEAALAYNIAAFKHFGEFACINQL